MQVSGLTPAAAIPCTASNPTSWIRMTPLPYVHPLTLNVSVMYFRVQVWINTCCNHPLYSQHQIYQARHSRQHYTCTHHPFTCVCASVLHAGVWTNTCCSHPLYGQQPNELDKGRHHCLHAPFYCACVCDCLCVQVCGPTPAAAIPCTASNKLIKLDTAGNIILAPTILSHVYVLPFCVQVSGLTPAAAIPCTASNPTSWTRDDTIAIRAPFYCACVCDCLRVQVCGPTPAAAIPCTVSNPTS
jgi:hypothetical protein